MDKVSNIKVLIIDDESYVRDSIKGFLEDYSYQVFEAVNGRHGLNVFEQESPDIVLCDLRMPEMDGLEVLDYIVRHFSHIPIIIVSGAGNITDTVEALRRGAWDYILKPVQDMTVLLHSIDKSIERASLIKEKELYRKELEALNEKLLKSIETLEKTKDQLVQSEKMAALGGLVAGVAHEINTPVGVAITAASYLKDKTENIKELCQSNALKRSELELYLNNVEEVSSSILSNMERAASLIKSFKRVAVDQVIEEKRIFNVKKYFNDVLISLKPAYKNKGCTIEIKCDDTLEVFSYPGAYSQIISNLVMNSVIHGFKDKKDGKILFDIAINSEDSAISNSKEELNYEDSLSSNFKEALTSQKLKISYKDNGQGMSQEQVDKVFNPFYTTMRGQGGTGLGMSIVFNIVTQTLGGTIECKSIEGVETEFIITVQY